MMNHSTLTLILALPILAVAAAGCDDDDPMEPEVTYDLSFSGDDSFGAPHSDQAISVVVRTTGGVEVASDEGTVADDDPSFSFEFEDVLEEGTEYELAYWIDSNFAGGTAGVCDPPADDHQWLIEIEAVDGDVVIADTHRAQETESVCDLF